VVLLVALWRRTSAVLAVAVTLFVATSPQDMALTATIWNPPLSVALVKVAIALTLVAEERRSLPWQMIAVVPAWLAVQAHSSAIFVAAPVLTLAPLLALRADGWIAAAKRAALIAGIVAILQIPYALHAIENPSEQRLPGLVASGVARTLTQPVQLRPVDSFVALSDAATFILGGREGAPWIALVLAGAIAIAAVRLRRDLPFLLVSVAPLVLATAGFSTWQYAFDHYWYLPLMPSAALTMMMAATAWQPGATSITLLAIVLVLQPTRLMQSRTVARLPEYRLLVDGAREIRSRTSLVAAVEAEFALPPTTDPGFVYRVFGGQVRDDAPISATIGVDGRVVFRPRTPAP
jgi:hypothetical protein